MSRLKRQDLVKDFELVVQQEIKNHNDAVSASNLEINRIRAKVDENHHLHLERENDIRNHVARVEFHQNELEQYLQSIKDDLREAFHDTQKQFLSEVDKLRKGVANDLDTLGVLVRGVQKENDAISKELNKLRMEEHGNRDSLENYLMNTMRKLREEVREMLAKHMDNAGSAVELEKKMMALLDSHKVDVRGVDQTIDKLNEQVQYQEKKLEACLNRLARLLKNQE